MNHIAVSALRLEWLHSQASLHRWREEAMLLHEELRRVLEWYKCEVFAWETRSQDGEGSGSARADSGRRAYARKQAYFRSLERREAEKSYAMVANEWIKV